MAVWKDSRLLSMVRPSMIVPILACVQIVAGGAEVQARMVDLNQPEKTVVGYGLPWTVRPGETIDFKVSTYAPGDYKADLIRLKSADEFDRGKRFQFDKLKASFERRYAGRNQPVDTGSFVEIANAGVLDAVGSFTIVASVLPTLVPVDGKGGTGAVQHLIARWDAVAKSGWSLALDEEGKLAFYVGDGKVSQKVAVPSPLVIGQWYQVSAAYNASDNNVNLRYRPVSATPGNRFYLRSESVTGAAAALVQQGSLRFAAASGGQGNGPLKQSEGVFNGKLDTVRIARGALDADTADKLLAAATPVEAGAADILGFWDFAKGTGTTVVHDLGRNGLQGTAVNLPYRAIPGANWDGSSYNWQERPEQYGAMYFHDDAVYDLEWKNDFSFKIPSGLKSGVYAARLRLGASEDYVPFFVAPSKGKPKAKIAFLLPTVSYLAYSNVSAGFNARVAILEMGPDGKEVMREEDPVKVIVGAKANADFLINRPEMPGGVYERHSDGTLVQHASRRYPNITTRPDAATITLNPDLDIIEWLDHEGFEYDVITDDLLQAEGVGLLEGYNVVISGNHPEYVTPEIWDALEAYQNKGGRFMYLGGNGYYWVTSFHRQVDDVIEVRKPEYGNKTFFQAHQEFDGHRSGYWWDAGREPRELVGVRYSKPMAMEGGGYYRKLPAASNPRVAFMFEGIEGDIIGDFGKYAGGAAAEEVDSANFKQGTPRHALVVATSENIKWPYDASGEGLVDWRYRLNVKSPKADIVFYETPNGGAVFSVGSMGWRASLNHNGFNNSVSRMTGNVLRRFADPRPFEPAK
ncbi:N,N-dimethylformamidase beta subunit family domain-containing protein [Sphingosinicella sp.]|uniref:N,N-dimethylformamidase beta subunit family domain-containing protein n=1 Tax=Sphingosinicella sp. TaxID=1917971 RepID=UPI0035B4DEB6